MTDLVNGTHLPVKVFESGDTLKAVKLLNPVKLTNLKRLLQSSLAYETSIDSQPDCEFG